MKPPIFNRITLSVALLSVGTLCTDVHADWGSLQGNNRSAPQQPAFRPQPQPQQPAFRPQPQPETRPEPFRPLPEPQVRTPEPQYAPQPVARPEPPHQEAPPAPQRQPLIGQPFQQSPATADHRREQPQTAENARAAETDRRRMDIDADRRQSFFWSDYHRGMRVDRLPDGYRRFRFHDHDYFYFEGVFYDDQPSGFVVITPPVDADIPELPPGVETVVANGTVYYYAGGVFYVEQSDGSYIVVAAPIGVTVSELPPDAVQVVVNGIVYYQSGGTYYLPVMQNGVTAYLTVTPPQ